MMPLLVGAALVILVAVAAAALVVRARIVVVRVSGPSMAPTLRSGDRLLVRRSTGAAPRAGDIVVLPEPGPCRRRVGKRSARPSFIVKRVAAAPGDPAPAFLPSWERTPAGVVPPGHLVLLGDNPPMSRDSRQFGPVRIDALLGVVIRRLGEEAALPPRPPDVYPSLVDGRRTPGCERSVIG
jgi:signal peptidase I